MSDETFAGLVEKWRGLRESKEVFLSASQYGTYELAADELEKLQRRVEELRELSDKATAGPWLTGKLNLTFKTEIFAGGEPSLETGVATPWGETVYSKKTFEECEANGQFIVACVNYVRSILGPVKGSNE